ncbi:MAG TPA: hypothetical protein VGM83_21105, partial [Devosiaceae bacterium]
AARTDAVILRCRSAARPRRMALQNDGVAEHPSFEARRKMRLAPQDDASRAARACEGTTLNSILVRMMPVPKMPATGLAEMFDVMLHAQGDPVDVRDFVAAEPHGIAMAIAMFIRRPVCESGRYHGQGRSDCQNAHRLKTVSHFHTNCSKPMDFTIACQRSVSIEPSCGEARVNGPSDFASSTSPIQSKSPAMSGAFASPEPANSAVAVSPSGTS